MMAETITRPSPSASRSATVFSTSPEAGGNLHWLDNASSAFLDQMADARAGTRSLLLLNFRPEYRADWMKNSWYRQIPLSPLDQPADDADMLGQAE